MAENKTRASQLQREQEELLERTRKLPGIREMEDLVNGWRKNGEPPRSLFRSSRRRVKSGIAINVNDLIG